MIETILALSIASLIVGALIGPIAIQQQSNFLASILSFLMAVSPVSLTISFFMFVKQLTRKNGGVNTSTLERVAKTNFRNPLTDANKVGELPEQASGLKKKLGASKQSLKQEENQDTNALDGLKAVYDTIASIYYTLKQIIDTYKKLLGENKVVSQQAQNYISEQVIPWIRSGKPVLINRLGESKTKLDTIIAQLKNSHKKFDVKQVDGVEETIVELERLIKKLVTESRLLLTTDRKEVNGNYQDNSAVYGVFKNLINSTDLYIASIGKELSAYNNVLTEEFNKLSNTYQHIKNIREKIETELATYSKIHSEIIDELEKATNHLGKAIELIEKTNELTDFDNIGSASKELFDSGRSILQVQELLVKYEQLLVDLRNDMFNLEVIQDRLSDNSINKFKLVVLKNEDRLFVNAELVKLLELIKSKIQALKQAYHPDDSASMNAFKNLVSSLSNEGERIFSTLGSKQHLDDGLKSIITSTHRSFLETIKNLENLSSNNGN